VIGVGLLGSAIARVLLDAGYQIVGYDIMPERLAELAQAGGVAARSAAEVARRSCEIFLVLPTLESVEESITGDGGVLAGSSAETVVIQMSTISPELAVRMEAATRARRASFLDAPISGTSAMVARRDCVVTVGGERSAYQAGLHVLEALARHVYFVGACGMGSYLKLVTNLAMGLNGMVVAEALTLARRAGLDPAQTVEILSHGAAASKMLEVRGPAMVEGRFDPKMKVELFLKDIRLILDVAQALHVPVPLTATMQQLYTAASAAGQGEDDLAGIVRVYQALAGLPEPG
jgi:3-hydroxyisobutyrate dehydrogenase-like beta-hydroxyacid dehydrogenase